MLKVYKTKFEEGFTLIELIVVGLILAFLGSFVVINFSASRDRALDSRRISDLKEYQIAFETYANANDGKYPQLPCLTSIGSACDPSSLCGTTPGTPFSWLTSCPKDPKDNIRECGSDGNILCGYRVRYDQSGYVLWAVLRRPQYRARAHSDVDTPYFVICSNGRNGLTSFEPNSIVCPLGVEYF